MKEQDYREEDEITLKAILLGIKDYSVTVLRHWWLIILIALPFAAWFAYVAYTTPTQFTARLTFMINEDEGGAGGLGGLASQFGFNLGAGGGEFNKEKIVSLSKSGRIIHPVIMDSIEIAGKSDLLGNHLLDIYGIRAKWKEAGRKKFENFYFTHDSIPGFTRIENSVLKTCYGYIVGSAKRPALSTCSFNEDSGILTIKTKTLSEELSYQLTNSIYDKLSTFYIKQQTEPQQKSFAAIKAKVDSLNNLISAKEYELAKIKDANNNVILRQYRLREDRLQRELPAYALQYGTLLKNLENADFVLNSSTPFFQVIDAPFYPLGADKKVVLISLILGTILGGVVGVTFVIAKKIIQDALK